MTDPATLEEDFKDFLGACPQSVQPREVQILESLFGLRGGAPKTLEAVGASLGLTRERVRQLKERALKRIREGLTARSPTALSLARKAVSDRGGICDLQTIAHDIRALLPATQYNSVMYLRWLVEVSAHLELQVVGRDTVVGAPVRFQDLERGRQVVREALAENTGVSVEALCSKLGGLWPETDSILLAQYARCVGHLEGHEVLPGLFARRAWTRVDWAEFVLEQEGRPLHFREIARRASRLSGKNFSATGFNSLLNTARTFVRVGAGDFALARWGAKRYGRFDEVIASYLADQGRAVHESKIKADLLKLYTVKEATVSAMLQWFPDRFVYFGGGYWALAGQDPGIDAQLEVDIERHLRALSRAAPLDELHERLQGDSHEDENALSEVRRTLYLSDMFRQVGSWGKPKFLLAADVKAPPEERAAELAIRILQDFKHPMSLGELVARISQRFFAGRYTPSSDNLRLRLSAYSEVEELEGLYRLRGKRVFSS